MQREVASLALAPTVKAKLIGAGFLRVGDLHEVSATELRIGVLINQCAVMPPFYQCLLIAFCHACASVTHPPDSSQVRFLVVDSIAYPFRHEFEDLSARTRLLHGLAQKLLQLASQHNIASHGFHDVQLFQSQVTASISSTSNTTVNARKRCRVEDDDDDDEHENCL
ncbi:RA51C protein, partial [Polypterus senegalus]